MEVGGGGTPFFVDFLAFVAINSKIKKNIAPSVLHCFMRAPFVNCPARGGNQTVILVRRRFLNVPGVKAGNSFAEKNCPSQIRGFMSLICPTMALAHLNELYIRNAMLRLC